MFMTASAKWTLPVRLHGALVTLPKLVGEKKMPDSKEKATHHDLVPHGGKTIQLASQAG